MIPLHYCCCFLAVLGEVFEQVAKCFVVLSSFRDFDRIKKNPRSVSVQEKSDAFLACKTDRSGARSPRNDGEGRSTECLRLQLSK